MEMIEAKGDGCPRCGVWDYASKMAKVILDYLIR